MSLELALERFLDKGAAMGTGAGLIPAPITELYSCPQ